jgi:hypothetical protein
MINNMDTHAALRELCGSESRFRLFKALYEAPDREYHLRGLAAAARVDPSQVHKLLPGIVEAGLCEQVQGRPYARYRARKDHPFFGPLSTLFQGGDAQSGHQDVDEIDLRETPVLRTLLWTGRERDRIPAREALRHYERNWRFVQRAPLDRKEKKVLDRLIKAYGTAGLVNG